MSTNKLRNMTAEESIELLKEIKSIFEERVYFGYNTSLINPFQEQIALINNVLNTYVPNANVNILDIHGMSIVNSILKVNAISTRFTDKFIYNAMRYENEPDYKSMIHSIDTEFVSYMDSKGYDGVVELNRIKKLITDLSIGPVRVRPVNLTVYGSEENITEAFDYHLLVYIAKCLRIENEVYKSKFAKFDELRIQNQTAGTLKTFHTSYFNDVSSCRSSCVGLCSASCDATCYGCGGGCAGQCTAKCADCSASCTNDCAADCTGGCKGCSGCSNECNGCIAACSSTCGNECTEGCGECTGSCFGTTTGANTKCGCGGMCTTECSDNCTSNASAPTNISVDPEPPIVVEPDPLPPPDISHRPTDPSSYIPSHTEPSHPSSGWVPTSGSTGYYIYNDGNGNTYRTDEMPVLNQPTGNYKTPWDGNKANHQYYKK